MAAPLNTCTAIEQHGVVRFLWAKNMEAKDIHKEMLPMYGEHCLSRQAVHNWVQKFSEGRTSTEDEHRAGRPVEIAMPESHVDGVLGLPRRTAHRIPATWPHRYVCLILHDSDETSCRHSPEATRPPH